MDEIVSGIYEIRNIVNGHVYIGSSVNIERRWKHHASDLNQGKHHSQHLQRSWNKYGKENFKFVILEQCSPDKSILIEREQFYIDMHSPEYNIAPKASSPMLGRHHTKETKARFSAVLIGNKRSIGNKNNLGHKLSDEHKEILRERNKGNKYNLGREVSQEHRDKIAVSLRATKAKQKKAKLDDQYKDQLKIDIFFDGEDV